MTTEWSLHVRGRLFTRIALRDAAGDELARFQMLRSGDAAMRLEGLPGADRCRATEPDGTIWELAMFGSNVALERDGTEPVRSHGRDLRAGDHGLRWALQLDGSRTGQVTNLADETLLNVVPGPGGRRPWAVLRFNDALPHPLPVALAVCGPLLVADVVRHIPGTSGVGGGS